MNDMPPRHQEWLAKLAEAAEQPVITGEDRRFRYEQYRVIGDDGPVRLTVTYANSVTASPEPLHVEESPWDLAIAGGHANTPVRESLSTAHVHKLPPETWHEMLIGVKPTLKLQGLYYVEALYFLGSHVVRLFYGRFLRTSPLPFEVMVELYDFTSLHFKGVRLPTRFVHVSPSVTKHGVNVSWEAEYMGHGQLNMYFAEDGKLHCQNDNMNKEFIKEVFAHMVDNLTLDD